MIIYVIRHFEKDLADSSDAPGDSEHDLSTIGRQRAKQLADFFPKHFGVPSSIYTFKINSSNSPGRGIETCTPLADKCNLPVIAEYTSDQYDPASTAINGLISNLSKPFLLCWEHHNIPPLVGLLLTNLANTFNVANVPQIPTAWDGDNFDDVWKITYGEGVLKFEVLPHALVFPAAAHATAPQALFSSTAMNSKELKNSPNAHAGDNNSPSVDQAPHSRL